ncbi:CRISPR-associated helicase/endonuclease Cas3 [Chlorobaculum limnaeum]|uniref:CRISPR-associated helicase/endonuclease Cas3 n=1 Tax=Chlorobaculum limnaeum TaxID=274537 RepID=A0A1D8D020_CHLLM|nr:CRISPR-associated helicase/endonuclease Cas3 [Chlorobaculum limnaeum]AOS84546.1 CRISPR-associated helicase/endonuclease Cas3 [Chlorobaculum limnaeum]
MRYPKSNRKPEAPAEHPPLPLENCLAKSRKIDADRSVAGRTVLDHCRIAGEVARELIARSPAYLREPFFPGGSALVAACHDLGKVCPTFQKKIHKAIEGADPTILDALNDVDPEIEKNWGGHAGVSQCALEALEAGKTVASIAGCHHGYAPKLGGRTADAESFGGAAWQAKRTRLLELLMEATGERLPEIRDPLHARVLAGLTSVADWIGSGAIFDDPGEPWQNRVAAAVDTAGFTPPLLAPGLSFREIFPFEPNPIQRGLIEAACRPGLYILEAPMGIGKTEAALYAAYALVAAGKARGIYFALPTQLTSNRIHGRVERFLDRVLEPDSPHRAALLLHGNAWLQEFDLGAEAAPGCSWFSSAKRGLLAPFAVGTVDQALMASMNVKHGFVRAFGIAGKVVILDEVHSYDAYTGTILDRLVGELRRLRCTVIILSATLTGERRSALLGAERSAEAAYPLITALPADAPEPLEIAPETTAGNEVTIRQTLDCEAALDEALDRADSGQQVLWIENTVSEAQEAYKLLAARSSGMAIECGLLHSRFIHRDREALEEEWVTRYGADGAAARRERGRILVGTQVLEQSLDIDADFLVTRLCPTDMLLQRIGRLWRHSFHQRPAGARCEAWIVSAQFEAAEQNPGEAFGNSAKVYSPYVLLRTLQAWAGVETLSLPGDIRGLLERTYEAKPESEAMAKHKAELQKRKEMLETFALQSVSPGLGAKPDTNVTTRYSDIDSVELLLLQSVSHNHAAGETTVTLLDGKTLTLPHDFAAGKKREQRKLAARLATQTLQVADYAAPTAPGRNTLTWLKPYFYLGDPSKSESLLRVAIVGEGGQLRLPGGGAASGDYELSYNPRLGYQYKKR